MENTKQQANYFTTKSLFIISILVVVITIISIWLLGLGQNRTLFTNSIISTTIISTIFFLFITYGLYKGFQLKDDVGSFTDKISLKNGESWANMASNTEVVDVGDGIEGIIFSILLWILFTVIIAVLLWFFGAVVWTLILIFMAALYWIFFRALRMVFRNAENCRSDFTKSISYAFFYTLLYNFWIYGIIFLIDYFGTNI